MLHLHRAHRADGLALALAQLLAAPSADAFALEVVAAPTRGMERWLAQRLCTHLGAQPGRSDGVCAGVDFPPPRRLIADALARASGVDPESDPWMPERMVWPLLDVVSAHLDAPWLRALAAYLGHGGDDPDPVRADRRLAIVRHIAQLFDRYGRHRPEMIEAWHAGRDGDGSGAPLGADARWQAQLWRELRASIGQPSPAERLSTACQRVREEPALLDLPGRLALFGLTRLAADELHALRALAAGREVHLFLLHPSPALWERIAQRAPAGGGPVPRRAFDPTATAARHPLLASWGRDAREMQVVLEHDSAGYRDHHHPVAGNGDTLLARLQQAIIADEPPPGAPLDGEADARPLLNGADASVQVHACHGQARQVEVLRDAVLHLLADDPTLEPRDVIVMCPDIETYAPLIQATFGAAGPDTAPDADGQIDLRVRLADRALRQTNPVLGAIAELLELAGQRFTASQVLSFADREPVRRRFGLRDDDLARAQRWIGDAGIRWGIDAAHRSPFKLDNLEAGTWQTGLDRIALGTAMTEDACRLFGEVLPLDDVESTAIDLAGRFIELVERLAQTADGLRAPMTVAAWAQALGQAAAVLTATAPRDAWQVAELERLLSELVSEAAGTGDERVLSLTEMRGLLAERLAGRPTRANFRTGHMTVCTLYPMRSVPHRVVCLLGLDDGAFPRRVPRDGDDLMLADPRVGERDPRSEDRQLLLDAVMAATEHLVITYTGHDERTNLARPPAVPVGELLDVIDATVRCDPGPARAQIETVHPLQPFDPRNFAPGALVDGRRWSFDRVALGGARALSAPRVDPPPFLDAPLPAADQPVIALDDLIHFVQHPVRAFLRQRLAITLGDFEDEVDDTLPVELDHLERWEIGQRLLDGLLAGVPGEAVVKAEVARGTLPPKELGRPVIEDVYPVANAIASAAAQFAPAGPDAAPIDVHVTLPDGRLLSGTVPRRAQDLLLRTMYSRLSPRHRLASWVALLAATAAAPEHPLAATTIGRPRGSRSGSVMVVRIAPLGQDAGERRRVAIEQLERLVDLYDRGRREPLVLPCATAWAYTHALRSGEDPLAAARAEWESEWSFPREDRDAEHLLVLGAQLSLAQLMAQPAREDERGDGWLADESSRFARLAHRLWTPLLAREEIKIA